MDDLRLRELVKPLANAIAPSKSLDAQRKVQEGFRDDGLIEQGLIAGGLPSQRIDWVVQPTAAAGVQVGHFPIPESSRIGSISMIATANVSATFTVDVLVNGVRATSGAIRVGSSQAKGALSVAAPAGSVVSVETKASIPQGVTVSVFYRPTED